jgi:sugar phosphate isomerase/epimerase
VGYKLAAFSDDLVSDFSAAAELAVGLRLDGLAVRHVGGRNVRDLDDAEVRQVKRTADERGLAISAVGSPYGRGFFIDDDASSAAAHRLLERMIRQADILDSPNIRVFTLWLRGQDPLERWTRRPDYDACLERLAERLAPSVAMAERAGMNLMIELEGASYVGQVAEFRRLMTHLDSPAVVLCWDVCNGWWSGELPWPDGWREAQGLPIVDVQTKDVVADPEDPQRPTFRQVVVGEGDVPYTRILPELIRSGYDGWFTVERVYHPRKPEEHPELQRDALADVANLRAILESAVAEQAPPGVQRR